MPERIRSAKSTLLKKVAKKAAGAPARRRLPRPTRGTGKAPRSSRDQIAPSRLRHSGAGAGTCFAMSASSSRKQIQESLRK